MIKTVILNPSRLGCPSIPGTMKGMIMSMPGVKNVKVRYEERSLEITFDDNQTSAEDIIKKIGQEMGLAMSPALTEKNGVNSGDGKKEENGAADTCPM